MPKVSLDGLMENFVITNGRLQVGIPVDQFFAAIDPLFSEEIIKRAANGGATHVVQCKASSTPIAG